MIKLLRKVLLTVCRAGQAMLILVNSPVVLSFWALCECRTDLLGDSCSQLPDAAASLVVLAMVIS